MDSTFLVIGIGNTLRRDDGAGWFFAQALADALHNAGAAVELILQQQLTPETAEIVAEQAAAQVVFVDASVEAANGDARHGIVTKVRPLQPATTLHRRRSWLSRAGSMARRSPAGWCSFRRVISATARG